MAQGSVEASGRRFSLLRTLGEGSFGSVYLAEMEGAGGFRRRVALKLLNQTWEPGSDAARRLRDEARILGRLDHANIVRVDDLVLLDGRWGLVMEYVNGADMERIFAWSEETGRPLSPRAIAELGTAVAHALDAAWGAVGEDGKPLHVVHRDIKPSNVRLSETGQVKVLDFGVARAAFSGREARTERVRYGSLGYMAPERLLGEPDTPAGDIYALGVMLYELATAKLYGRAELGVEQQRAQVAAAREAMVERVGDTALVTLVESMLAYAPDDRPSAAELADTLQLTADTLGGIDLAGLAREVLPQLPPPSSEDGVRGRVLQESSSRTSGGSALVSSATLVFDPDAPDAPPAPPTARRGPPVAAILAGLGLVVALAVGAIVLGGDPPPAPTPPVAAAPPPAVAPPVTAPAAPAEVAPEPAVAPTIRPTSPEPKGAGADLRRARPPGEKGAKAAEKPAAAAEAPAQTEAAASAPATTARLRAAKFTLTGGENLKVTCGDVSGSGVTSTLLRNFPPGDCVVTAAGLTDRVRLDEPRGVSCVVDGDSLQCR